MFHSKARIKVMPPIYRLSPVQKSEHLADSSRRFGATPVSTTSGPFRYVLGGSLALISSIHTQVRYSRTTYPTRSPPQAFRSQQQWAVWNLPLMGDSEGPTLIFAIASLDQTQAFMTHPRKGH